MGLAECVTSAFTPSPAPQVLARLAGGSYSGPGVVSRQEPSPQPLSRSTCAGEGLLAPREQAGAASLRHVLTPTSPHGSPLPRTGKGAGGEGFRRQPSLSPTIPPQPAAQGPREQGWGEGQPPRHEARPCPRHQPPTLKGSSYYRTYAPHPRKLAFLAHLAHLPRLPRPARPHPEAVATAPGRPHWRTPRRASPHVHLAACRV